MLNRSSFHTHSHTETFAPFINCAIETMSDINQALLRFIDIMNLLHPQLCIKPHKALQQH